MLGESRILALESVIPLKKTGTPWHPKTKATNWESVIQYAGANCKIMKHILYVLENIYNYSTEKGPWGTIRTHYTKKQKKQKNLESKDGKRQGTLKRKDISFMNNLISFFFLAPLYLLPSRKGFFFCAL